MRKSSIEKKLDRILGLLLDQNDKPMSVREVCKYLNITSSHIYKMTSLKIIPYHKPNGKLIYFRKSEIDEWVYRKRISSKNESSEIQK
jgi:excisionase family DNA binding protein